MSRARSIVIVSFLVACASDDDPPPAAAPEREAAAEATAALAVVQQTLVLTDAALFAFDPDLDPKASADDNQGAIEENLSSAGCATVTVARATGITADFGAGCSFTNGSETIEVSGALTVKLTFMGGGDDGGGGPLTITVDVVFTDLVVNGLDLDGTASFITSDGTTLEVLLDLASGGSDIEADVTVAGTMGSFTSYGSASLANANGSVALTIEDVLVAQGDCWPRGGSVGIASGNVAATLLYSEGSATSGQATLTVGPASLCQELASHGTCVATACPAAGE